MCFSAAASFTSGAILSVAGVTTLKKVNRRKDIPFAIIPLLFGIQQLAEGVVWLSLTNNNQTCTAVSSYSFLFFAFILWPAFVPFVAGQGERDKVRKRIFHLFQIGGLSVTLYFLYFLINNPLTTYVNQHSISYQIFSPYQFSVASAYVFFTCGSLLFSRRNILKLFGAASTVAVAITYYFYQHAFTSVWCFFSGILSMIIYWHFRKNKRHQRNG